MASKDISSYFSKPTTTTPAKRSATTAAARSSQTSPEQNTSVKQPASSPSTTSTPGKGSGLSAAMREAIVKGAEEGERDAKRAKVENTTKPPAKVASLFNTNKTTTTASTITIPTATSKEDLVKSLEDYPETKELLQLELDTLGQDWLLALQGELTKSYFLNLKEFITKEQSTKKVFPPANDIYSWSRLCPLKDVRIVIVGQDPYHDDGQAHGFAFSVRKGVRIPPSLRNIYKEIHDEIPAFVISKHGDLTEWAKHGVLLLNTSLTVRAHEAGSHSNRGWESFTAAIIKVITSRRPLPLPVDSSINTTEGLEAGKAVHKPEKGVVLMAWGKHAQNMVAAVDKKTNLVLSSAHPSPFAAMKGFFGNKHFVKANEWLVERYGDEGGIDWASLGEKS